MGSLIQNQESDSELSQSDITRAIELICKNNESQQFYLITTSELRNVVRYEIGKQVTQQTIRNYGVSKSGYYQKKYPDIFAWNDAKNPRRIGLVVKPEEFLEELSE